jgi:hypothetical protein
MSVETREYEVGTVIYVIDPKAKMVIPARINEQIVTRKMDGSTTTHNVEFPNRKTAVLEELDVLHFMNLDAVRAHLMDRAAEVIDAGINQAQRVEKSEFGGASETPTEILESSIGEKVQVTLPDGKIANVKINIPEEFLDESTGS